MLKESKNISDYLDIGFLQMLQDNCSKALGLAFVMVDYRGCPITHYSGFTPYCRLGRRHQDFFEMCKQCDAHGGLQAVITGQPYIYRCHAGLVDFALPLICDGTYVGSLMGGQIRLSREEEAGLERILPVETDWRRDQAMNEAYNKMQTVSYEKIKSAVTLLRDLILLMIQNDGPASRITVNADNADPRQPDRTAQGEDSPPQSVEKAFMEKKAVEREAGRKNFPAEFSFKRSETERMKQHGRLRYFYFVMNVITQLAYQEKAAGTGAVAYDFADVMRYMTESDQEISTLGEELSYVGALLRIQKAWVGDALRYSISVPEQYGSVNCPYMVLEPLAELAASGCETGRSRQIEISVSEEQGDLLVRVASNYGMTLEQMDARPDGASKEEGFSLRDSDQSLKRIFGRRYGLSVTGGKEGHMGNTVCFRLPLKKDR